MEWCKPGMKSKEKVYVVYNAGYNPDPYIDSIWFEKKDAIIRKYKLNKREAKEEHKLDPYEYEKYNVK